jgi:hypothetical protein
MTETEVIERVAAETELEPEAVERVLEAASQRIVEAIEMLAEGEPDADVFFALLLTTAAAWRSQGQDLGQLIATLTPEHPDLPTPAAVLQARRNAEARSALLREFGALRSSEIAELAGSRAANRAALANRWRAEQRLVAVPVGDELLYPGFQFSSEGRPHPTVRAALAALRSNAEVSDWQAALWFVGPNGWLGGRRPVDLLDAEPDAVSDAAHREAAERVF